MTLYTVIDFGTTSNEWMIKSKLRAMKDLLEAISGVGLHRADMSTLKPVYIRLEKSERFCQADRRSFLVSTFRITPQIKEEFEVAHWEPTDVSEPRPFFKVNDKLTSHIEIFNKIFPLSVSV